MDTYVLETIRLWARSKKSAEQNTAVLLAEGSVALDECVRRIKVVKAAEDAMLELQGRSELPQELLTFFEAREDSGCIKCWVSSNPSSFHPECRKKIDRYFRVEEDLIVYGLNI